MGFTPLSGGIIEAERAAVIAEARSWLLTPFAHSQRMKGVGVDCAQLLIGVYSALGFVEAFRPAYYAADWFLHGDEGKLESVISRFCRRSDLFEPGDIATFRFGRFVSHAAIVLDFPSIIHADRMAKIVTEDRAGEFDALGRRLAGCWTLTRWSSGTSDV